MPCCFLAWIISHKWMKSYLSIVQVQTFNASCMVK
jgi:hypothetical protein